MRGAIGWIEGRLSRLAAWIAAAVPVLLLLVWGGAYLVNVVRTLEAPGRGLRVQYRAQGGLATVEADHYALDTERRLAHVRRLRLTGPDGRLVARVERGLIQFDAGAIRIEAADAWARIVRQPDDRFSIQSVLPVAEGDEPPRPLVIELAGIDFEYVDESRAPALRQAGRIATASLAAMGTEITGTARAELDRAGRVDLMLRASNGTLWGAKLSTAKLDLTALLPHIDRWIPTRDWADVWPVRASTLVADAAVELAASPGRPIRVLGDATIRGAGVSLPRTLESAAVDAKVRFSGSGASGTVSASEIARSAQFQGALSWAQGIQGGGNLSVSASASQRLWPRVRELIPKEVALTGARYAGWIGWTDSKVRMSGELSADRVAVFEEPLSATSWNVAISERGLQATLGAATYQSAAVRGAVSIAFDTGELRGFAESARAPLDAFAKRFGVDALRGTGQAQAMLRGDFRRPEVVVQSTGAATWTAPGQAPRYLGLYRARAAYAGDGVTIDRLALRGPSGASYLGGRIGLGNGRLDLTGAAGGVDLGAWAPELEGSGFASFRATGTWRQPRVETLAQVAGLEFADRFIPITNASATVTRDGVRVTSWEAVLGATRATGTGLYRFGDRSISGVFEARDIELADWTSGSVSGEVQLTDGTISGRIDQPRIAADLAGEGLEVAGLNVDRAQASVKFAGGKITAQGSVAALGGAVKAEATYDVDRGDLSASADLADIQAAAIPWTPAELALDGVIAGSASVRVADGRTETATAGLRLRGMGVNGSRFGSGELNASASKGLWSGSLELGQLAQFITVSGAQYNESTREISGEVQALRVNAENLLAPFARAIQRQPDSVRRLLDAASGFATVLANVGGTLDAPNVDASMARLDEIEVGGRDAGRIEMRGGYRGGEAIVQDFVWRLGDGTLRAQGRLDDDQLLQVDAEIADMDVSWLASALATPLAFPLAVSASLVLTGPLRDPSVDGTVSARLEQEGHSASVDLHRFNLAGGELQAEGVFYADGFTGTVTAGGPLDSVLSKEASIRPLVARARLTRALADIQALTDSLGEGVAGTLMGDVEARLTAAGVEYSGAIQLREGRLPAPGLEAVLSAAEIDVRFDRETATITGSAQYGDSGRLSLNAAVQLGNPLAQDQTLEAFLASTLITGALEAAGVALDVRLGQPNERLRTTVRAKVDLSGPIHTPRISGEAGLIAGELTVPAEWPEGKAAKSIFAPTFDRFRIVADSPMRIRSSGADVKVVGGATLDGPLDELRVNAPLLLTEGKLDLPTARVALEPLGAIRLRYEQGVARLDVSLEGRTAVSALKLGDTVQRYDVYLDVRGNLLETGGLRLSARSEPPDLSSDEILALLGQKAAFERIALGGARGQDPFRDALFTFATPMLTSSLTDPIAGALGFDYLRIDYNILEHATITAARTFSRGLTLQARRQLFDPVTGRPRYDVRLSYRLPRARGILSQTRLALGFDQDRPWRLSIEYSIRF